MEVDYSVPFYHANFYANGYILFDMLDADGELELILCAETFEGYES